LSLTGSRNTVVPGSHAIINLFDIPDYQGSTNPLICLSMTSEIPTLMREKFLIFSLIFSPSPFFYFSTEVEQQI
jgi:hypothetical protein